MRKELLLAAAARDLAAEAAELTAQIKAAVIGVVAPESRQEHSREITSMIRLAQNLREFYNDNMLDPFKRHRDIVGLFTVLDKHGVLDALSTYESEVLQDE